MNDNATLSSRGFEKPLLGIVVFCLVVLAGTMVFYRVTNPFLDVREVRMNPSADQGPMADITQLMQQLENNPNDVDALRSLGNAFMHMKAWDRALMFWNRVLAIEPQDTMALNQKGVSLFQKQDYPASAATFATLLEIDADNVYALFNLGILHRHFLDNPAKGEGYLQAILKLESVPEDVLQAVRQELAAQPAPSEGSQDQVP
ncbi:tetratricopeptide repeat protein [Desulfoplanes sp. PS50]|jgi:lipoprotein NlpI